MSKFRSVAICVKLSFCLITFNCTAQSNSVVNVKTQNSNGLKLTGIIPGLKEGEIVFLKKWDVEKQMPVLLDSVGVKDGRFNFRYYVTDGPRLFWVQFSQHDHIIPVAMDNESVTISYHQSIDSIKEQNAFKYLRTDGSETAKQHLYLNFATYYNWIYTISKIDGEIRRSTSFTSKDTINYILGLLRAKELVNRNVGQILASQPVKEVIPEFYDNIPVYLKREGFFVDVFQLLDERIKNSYYGVIMKRQLALCVGQKAPDFDFIANDGKSIKMSDILTKNKLTVLHFWSGISADRVRVHSELALAYKKYKPKGLDVISVSLDANPEKWKRVVQEDKVPGYQTCDFKEEEGPIARMYEMNSKGTINVLIDQNGKIIAWDVDGPALFGYLYRYFGEL